jgi:SpoVK/Ycf46/Vps4 family AAA+-type ATPase
MGSKQLYGEIGRELQTILEDPRYKNIKVIATTNWLWRLSNALLRPGRLFEKYLVNYPSPQDLLKIIRRVLGECHDEKSGKFPELFSNLNKTAFVNKFAEKIHKEMSHSKYEIKYKDMDIEEGEVEGIDPEKGRILFTGADAKQVIHKAVNIVAAEGRQTLKEEDFKRAIKNTYEYNRHNPD